MEAVDIPLDATRLDFAAHVCVHCNCFNRKDNKAV